MRKPPALLSLAAGAALVLSACGGQSVEEARADAYASIQAMDGLSRSQIEEYEAQLNTAADTAAIDNIVANAQSASDEKLAADVRATAAASASASASAAAEALKDELRDVTLVGTSPGCEGKTLYMQGSYDFFEGDGRDLH